MKQIDWERVAKKLSLCSEEKQELANKCRDDGMFETAKPFYIEAAIFLGLCHAIRAGLNGDDDE